MVKSEKQNKVGGQNIDVCLIMGKLLLKPMLQSQLEAIGDIKYRIKSIRQENNNKILLRKEAF